MKKKALVSGDAGYIGNHNCKALARAGYEPAAAQVERQAACSTWTSIGLRSFLPGKSQYFGRARRQSQEPPRPRSCTFQTDPRRVRLSSVDWANLPDIMGLVG